MLHTGEGIWWKRHQSNPKLTANSGPYAADSVILLGSENNTTWGFAKSWAQLLPLDTINRQSPQEFTRWGNAVGKVLGTELTLVHTPTRPHTTTLALVERVDYGADLVGILPPDSQAPRFYSLASASKDATLEICVRQHPDGLCSGFLHALSIGATIEAFIQPNPDFRPASGKAPIVLTGAGTGIGPLVCFIRHNTSHHPMHLYWGGRCPQSDFLYESELNVYLKERSDTQGSGTLS